MTFIMGIAIKFGLIIVAVGGIFIGHHYFHVQDNNFIEEVVEEVVKDETGVDMSELLGVPDVPPSTAVEEISKIVASEIDKI